MAITSELLPVTAYSRQATRRAVITAILCDNPWTLYPAAVGIPLLGLNRLVLEMAWTAPAGLAGLALVMLGGMSLLIDAGLRRGRLEARHMASLRARQERVFLDGAAQLRDALTALNQTWAADQVTRILGQFEAFRTVLDQKIADPSRPLYHRYLGPAQTLAFTAIDHLRNVETLLRSIAAIDADKIGRRLAALEAGSDREAASLQDQLTIRQRTLDKVHGMVTETEEIIQTLLATADDLAKTDQADLDAALADFLAIAERNQQMIMALDQGRRGGR